MVSQDIRIQRKIKKNLVDLVRYYGLDVLFIAEDPDAPMGESAMIMAGEATADELTITRRLMNEFKHKLAEHSIELDFTLRRRADE